IGTTENELLPFERIPLTQPAAIPFQVENVLAAVAAAWALALPLEVIKKGLESFGGGPGRFNVFKTANGAAVVVDYAHNPSAVEAMVAALDCFPQPRRTLAFAGCNRREIDLFEMGRAAGDAFDRV